MIDKPDKKPFNPNFSSGPTAKRPGWSIINLQSSLVSRSHRSVECKKKLKEVIDRSKLLLELPQDYLLCIMPGSNTGALEASLWCLLGERGVDVLAWENFGKDWVIDVVDQLKINDTADPGPATNTFLQSAGDGNFEFAVVDSANFPVSGAISGTLSNNTLQNYSVTTQKIADKAITSAKFDTSISFVGTTVIFNPGDILTAINGAGYFNLTNPNINLPTNVVDSGNIQDGSVTGFKLANTLDLSTKTVTLPNASITIDKVLTAGNTTGNNLTVNNLTVNGTLTPTVATPTLAIAYAVALG